MGLRFLARRRPTTSSSCHSVLLKVSVISHPLPRVPYRPVLPSTAQAFVLAQIESNHIEPLPFSNNESEQLKPEQSEIQAPSPFDATVQTSDHHRTQCVTCATTTFASGMDPISPINLVFHPSSRSLAQ